MSRAHVGCLYGLYGAQHGTACYISLTGKTVVIVLDITSTGNTFQTLQCQRSSFLCLRRKKYLGVQTEGTQQHKFFPIKILFFFSFLPIVPWVSFWNRIFLQHWLLLMWWSLTAINNDHVCLTNLNQKEPYFIFVPWKAEPIRSKSSVNILGMGKSKTYLWCDASLQDTSK